jgi:hypothetical protein
VVIGLAGLGAVILTRFGSQNYPDTPVSVAPVAPAPALPAPRKRTVAKKAPTKRARS